MTNKKTPKDLTPSYA